MGLRFRRRTKLFPGVSLNISKSSVSTSVGEPGATVNFRGDKTTTTVGLPGSGLSYRTAHASNTPGTPTRALRFVSRCGMTPSRSCWLERAQFLTGTAAYLLPKPSRLTSLAAATFSSFSRPLLRQWNAAEQRRRRYSLSSKPRRSSGRKARNDLRSLLRLSRPAGSP